MKLIEIVQKIYSYNWDIQTLYEYRDLFSKPKNFKELNYLVAIQTIINYAI